MLVRAATRLGLYGRSVDRLVDVLVGGRSGSEGKGHIAAYLAPEYNYLIRVGGPNAGHTVYEIPEPVPVSTNFPQAPDVQRPKLFFGPGAVISVARLQKEIADCELTAERLSIDPASDNHRR